MKIQSLTPTNLRTIISKSNTTAMGKKHRYPQFEKAYFLKCLDYVEVNCNQKCFCKIMHNNHTWVIKADLDFNIFLEHFINLWARGSKSIISKANNQGNVSGRLKKAVPALRALKNRWNNWDKKGRSLPCLANTYRKTYLCDNSFEEIEYLINEIVDECKDDTTGIYTSKIISQIFPDIAIPFDTASKSEMRRSGYNPSLYGNGPLKNDIIELIKKHKLSFHQFRELDDAPSNQTMWIPTPSLSGKPTSCSRVIDKLFYS